MGHLEAYFFRRSIPNLSVCAMVIYMQFLEQCGAIPTTLEGPFEPATVRFDPSTRRGSDDLPPYHPRVVKKVAAIFPEQISLALSTPDAIWVSWTTGMLFTTQYPCDDYSSGTCNLLIVKGA